MIQQGGDKEEMMVAAVEIDLSSRSEELEVIKSEGEERV